jgi:hypothetical protein
MFKLYTLPLCVSTDSESATGECVLKHSTWMNPLALRPENALIRYHFFIHTRIIHPVGRPFAPCFECGARTSFPVYSHLLMKNPRVFNPGVLWSCCVMYVYFTRSSMDPGQISGVRSLLDSADQ